LAQGHEKKVECWVVERGESGVVSEAAGYGGEV
jgi:hypothetical protein